MTNILAVFALLTLIVSVTSAIIAIWYQLVQKDDLLKLVEQILTWKVIAGGLIIGGGATFKDEIKTRIKK